MGVKCLIIIDAWEKKIFTLACSPLENHTAENTADFIKETILNMFGKRCRDLNLHNVHDGAANVLRTSKLLGCEEPQHCLAHVLNSLLVTDGLSKCSDIQELLEKFRKIVTCLSFKSSSLMNESLRRNEDIEVYKNLRRMAEVNEIANLEDQFPAVLNEEKGSNDDHVNRESVQFDDPVSDDLVSMQPVDNSARSSGNYGMKTKSRNHKSLKQQIVTRWNSTLFMTESVDQLYDSADNLLKKLGRRELCLDEFDLRLLKQLVNFLKPFESLTEIVSGSNSLAILPLIKHKVTTLLTHSTDDLPEIKQLKTACQAKLQARFSLSISAHLSCLLDPPVNNIFPNEQASQILMQRAQSVKLSNVYQKLPEENIG